MSRRAMRPAETTRAVDPYAETEPLIGGCVLRPILKLAALGVAGLVAWNLLAGFVLPLFFGLVGLILKVAFWAVIVALVIWLFKRNRGAAETPA